MCNLVKIGNMFAVSRLPLRHWRDKGSPKDVTSSDDNK